MQDAGRLTRLVSGCTDQEPMFSFDLLIVQLLNGVQYGIMLFLIAAGLTLVLGIMNFVNLAHGSFYMLGGYFMATLQPVVGSWIVAAVLAIAVTLAIAMLLEATVLRDLYEADHLDQVLATFGLILFANEIVRIVFGPAALFFQMPEALNGQVQLFGGFAYPVYRLALIVIGLVVAALMYGMITRTRLGMLIRAGAGNRGTAEVLGVDINMLFTAVFGLGAALAALAGLLLGPLLSMQPGAGDPLVISAMVVLVIGGIGSVRGAFAAAILVGMVDTLGRAFLPSILRLILPIATADSIAPTIASLIIYALMAIILVMRPAGLFPARTG